jgi:hypothetical protein
MEAKRTARGLARRILLTALALTGSMSAFAQQAATTSADTWQFIVTPYLWTAGQSGSARIGTMISEQDVDASFSDLLSSLDWGAMATFEARKDRWGILADAFYIQLSHTSDPLLGGDLGTARLEATNTLVEVAGAYRAWENDTAFFDVLLGVRYFHLSANIQLYPSKLLPAGRYASNSVDWTDGFVGIRSKWTFAKEWSVLGYADVGTGGSEYSYQLIAGLGWNISKTFEVDLGYRLLQEDYSKTDFLYDMRTAGPYLGLSISW